MIRYQEIEFEYHTENLQTLLKRIEKKNPNFFEMWGETVEYLFNQNETYSVMNELTTSGFCIGVNKQEGLTYVWYIASDPCQVV